MRAKEEYSIPDLLCEWIDNEKVYVNDQNQEIDWLHDKTGSWKPTWIYEKFYRYTTIVAEEFDKDETPFNFTTGHMMTHKERALAHCVFTVWFGRAEKEFGCRCDNKTALKLRNRLTGQVLYMGWYDGAITVSTQEAWHPSNYSAEYDKIIEDN